MSTILELKEKRATIGKEIVQMRNKLTGDKVDFDATEKEGWDKANKEFDALGRQIEVAERAENVERELNTRKGGNRPGDEDFGNKKPDSVDPEKLTRAQATAFRAWAGAPSKRDLNDEEIEACKLAGVNPRSEFFDFRMTGKHGVEHRGTSPQSTTGSEGGNTISQGFVPNLERALKSYAAVMGVADVFYTATGNPLPWPTVNDTGTTGALLAENAQITVADVAFAQTTFNAYKITSKQLLLSIELMQDSAFNLAAEVGSMLGERIGRSVAAYGTTGTGLSQPGGIITGATSGKTAASATAIASDELIDLIHSVDPEYRVNTGVGFMMHDSVLAVVRKLKDGQSNYLWQPGYQNGVPDRLLGYPVYVNQSMASSVAASAKTVLFGDFKKFKMRFVSGVRLVRMDERYADYDQVGFVAFLRFDSKVLNAGTNPLKFLTQAAL